MAAIRANKVYGSLLRAVGALVHGVVGGGPAGRSLLRRLLAAVGGAAFVMADWRGADRGGNVIGGCVWTYSERHRDYRGRKERGAASMAAKASCVATLQSSLAIRTVSSRTKPEREMPERSPPETFAA